MTCPNCHAPDQAIIVRTVSQGAAVERQRQCRKCGWRWYTTELTKADLADLQALFAKAGELRRMLPEG